MKPERTSQLSTLLARCSQCKSDEEFMGICGEVFHVVQLVEAEAQLEIAEAFRAKVEKWKP